MPGTVSDWLLDRSSCVSAAMHYSVSGKFRRRVGGMASFDFFFFFFFGVQVPVSMDIAIACLLRRQSE